MDNASSIETQINDDMFEMLAENLDKEFEEDFRQEFAPNITQKGQNFVSYEINYGNSYDQEDSQEGHVLLTFSNKERARTNLGEQGAHASALALSLERIISVINYNFPIKEHDYEGLNILIGELYSIVDQDEFFLGKFFPPRKGKDETYNKDNIFILGQYGRVGLPKTYLLELFNELEAERKKADQRIDLLKRITNRVKGSGIDDQSLEDLQELTTLMTDLTLNSHQKITDLLKNSFHNTVDTKLSDDLKQIIQLELDLKLDYCASVTTKAARKIIEYQNKSPWTAFDRIPPRNDTERAFNNGEASRVTKSLQALRDYPRVNLNDTKLVEHIADLLYYTKVDNKYNVDSLNLYQEISDRHLGQNKGKKNKRGPIPRINRRTNDKDIFCYVITRHLATIFATFINLNELENKREIVINVINKIMTDNNNEATLAWNFNKKDSDSIKEKIISALDEWQKKSSLDTNLNFSAASIGNVSFEETSTARILETGPYVAKGHKSVSATQSPYQQITSPFSTSSMVTPKKATINIIRGSSSPTQEGQSVGMTTPITNKSRSSSWMSSLLKGSGGKSTSSTQYTWEQINANPILAFEWARRNIPDTNTISTLVNKCSKENLSNAAISAVNLVGTTAKQGLVNGLNQLARPSCSLDGTTIISMMRPRY